jgi:hypothetical protein
MKTFGFQFGNVRSRIGLSTTEHLWGRAKHIDDIKKPQKQ